MPSAQATIVAAVAGFAEPLGALLAVILLQAGTLGLAQRLGAELPQTSAPREEVLVSTRLGRYMRLSLCEFVFRVWTSAHALRVASCTSTPASLVLGWLLGCEDVGRSEDE